MPGRLFLTSDMAALAVDLGTKALDDEPPRNNIAPGQPIVTFTTTGLARMRWGIIPVGRVNARGRPVMETLINARSETVFQKSAYDGTGRAVVPVNGWYEWTGEKRRKTAWRIRPNDAEFLYFAAITDVWNGPGGVSIRQVATVTCPPNADVSPIHHRMAVVLEKADIAAWLEADPPNVIPLMRPWPEGRLSIEKADDVDWNGP